MNHQNFLFPSSTRILPPRNDTEKIEWLRLIRSENVGPVTFTQLMQRYNTAHAALKALPSLAKKGGAKKKPQICSEQVAHDEWNKGISLGGMLVCIGESAYPPLLAEIDSAPPVLWVAGKTETLTQESIAIVGARNASALAQRFAFQLAHELEEIGYCIVSGMARGIDTAAHKGALNNTAAILAGGIDQIYPPENKELYSKILDKGAIVSEMPFGMQPLPRHFPRRNRIISGIVKGIIIIEATEKSGSLISAQYALDQGREVMVVPGHPLDPRSGGCNRLIRDGAVLIRSSQDAHDAMASLKLREPIENLMDEPGRQWAGDIPDPDTQTPQNEQLRNEILQLCSTTPIEIDEIIRQTDGSTKVVLAIILELNLAGLVDYTSSSKIAFSEEGLKTDIDSE
jgi:DNA processing protein